MTLPSPELKRLIVEQIRDRAPAHALFEACGARRFDLIQVCEILTNPWDHLPAHDAADVEDTVGWAWHDVLYQLVEYAGPTRASQIAEATEVWRGIDVIAHHAGVKAWLHAEAAITDELPVHQAYASSVDVRITPDRTTLLLERLARVYPVEELAGLVDVMSPVYASVIGGVLRAHLSPLSALEALLAEVDAARILRALELFWGVAPGEGNGQDALLSTYARLCRAEFKPVDRAQRYAAKHGPPDWWLPILQREDLKSSHAALRLLETGMPSVDVAELLANSGYPDHDVLAALLENGIGTHTSLATLRESGWSADKMVQTLAHRGALLPEVRDSLEALGVPRDLQRPLLTRHWDDAVVDLVLAKALRALPRG